MSAPRLALGRKVYKGRRCMHEDVDNFNEGTRTGCYCKKCLKVFFDDPTTSKLVKGQL
jgi:late competence protein required for DNA uptake (superfamily II DNA/RNA helicase)